MATNKDDITSDLDNRLDELFGEDDGEDSFIPEKKEKPQPTKQSKASSDAKEAAKPKPKAAPKQQPAQSPLENLKSAMLEMDWELTDEVIGKFLSELDRLKTKLSSDKMIFSLLQLHESMGKYIRSKKVNAHPDSMKLVHSVFEGLEKIMASPSMGEDEKKKIAVGELKQFKAFKQKIGPAVKGAAQRIEGIDIEAIRKVIKAELSLFKEELLKEMKSMRLGR